MRKIGIGLASLLVAGCTNSGGLAKPVGQVSPASVHCVEVGGTLELQRAGQGQLGMCTLPDGSRIEEWALFQRDRASR
ncbi:DUF333 domain-containing protein [Bordetella avium]|uniref:Haemolysin n=1 Tax=Bordetella avium (strain 197N) TaxID=360910 RepID=Q2L271_BORA1|nr:DUF333 domain-containing protein [Bordetella avium]CAJ49101.1 putative haemolysin [Bordetella avium 197N]AZY52251.1 DUF333 domain-containing protein [Bordetella avium]RIQ14133.1 DUF333 domain-containing protein [Bordetella avium]RIQ18007.1 DUF333 domain-containing protein [Bordetella avium]